MIVVCADCKHFRDIRISLVCVSPKNGIDTVTGEVKRMWCHISRNTTDQCGYDGRYFEPKEPKEPESCKPVSWWRNLIGL
jgi:hypothetical protein